MPKAETTERNQLKLSKAIDAKFAKTRENRLFLKEGWNSENIKV